MSAATRQWLKFLSLFLIAAALPLVEAASFGWLNVSGQLLPIFVFAILGLGLNVVTGYTGMLHLGAAGFMAIGAYSFAISTCQIYPFQFGFTGGLLVSIVMGAGAGMLLGAPTTRLAGDYLAIVTLGFGEIIQNLLRNLDTITKGTQGINPLLPPRIFGYQLDSAAHLPWYYLYLFILFLISVLLFNLERSSIGRAWIAIREDELASRCMGIRAARLKLAALAFGSAICALAGALYANYLGSTGEPGNYDFQVSVIALCIVVVGGIGTINGVLLGALIMVGFNSILLVKAGELLVSYGFSSTQNVYASPTNWKYAVFGFALILTMRYCPHGLVGLRRARRTR